MDYEIDIDKLVNKQSKLETTKTKVKEIENNLNNSYLNGLSNTEISTSINKLKKSLTRLTKGYENSNEWFKKYNTAINETETNLTSFKEIDNLSITEFKGQFVDLFGRVTIPSLKTGATNTLKDSFAMDSAKAAFLGDVDDDSQYTVDPNFINMRKHMRLFNNTTGEEIQPDSTIVLRKGETIVITCKLPTNTGKIGELRRVVADDVYRDEDKARGAKRITTSYSDIDPNPNNVERVNYKHSIYWPQDRSLLHTNHYDWVITGTNVGTKQISQTCEYTTEARPGWYAKVMAGLTIKVIDDDK